MSLIFPEISTLSLIKRTKLMYILFHRGHVYTARGSSRGIGQGLSRDIALANSRGIVLERSRDTVLGSPHNIALDSTRDIGPA